MQNPIPPLATTTVGSFPRPAWLAETQRSEVTFRLEGAILHEGQDDATIIALHEQERLGLDILTDGEQRRTNFIHHIMSAMEGFDIVNRRPKSTFRRRENYNRLVPTVVGRVQRRRPAAVADFRFAQAHTSRPVKASVPGPMTIVDTAVDNFYGDEAALAMDVAEGLNQELLELQAAGCPLLQIDEPAMTRYQEKVGAYGLRALDRCLENVNVPTIIHLCYGYPGGEDLQHQYRYPDLLAQLSESRIGGFSLEFARSGYDPEILKVLHGHLVMYGCVDPGNSPPEPLDILVKRIDRALKYVNPQQLLLAPDCGLMTISRDLAWTKIQRLVEAAHEVRNSIESR